MFKTIFSEHNKIVGAMPSVAMGLREALMIKVFAKEL